MKIQFYGLLYLNEEDASTENDYVKSFKEKISIYVNCALNLSKSLRSKGISFSLLTNNKNLIQKLTRFDPEQLDIQEISFSLEIPKNIKFYSAHFKLDVFRYLSLLSQEYVGFCDLDVVCINQPPPSFINNVKRKIPMFYDITDQIIPAYGYEPVLSSLKAIHGFESEGRWSGGEFITGSPVFFGLLIKELDKLLDSYIKNIDNLFHVGDESLTSAALEILRHKGIYIADAGSLGIIGRYWNIKCLHPQKPFEYFQQCFLLHLPVGKRFLAGLACVEEIDLSMIRKYCTSRPKSPWLISKIKQMARKLLASDYP